MQTTPNDLELDAAKREILERFDMFVKMVHNAKDMESDYPADYTKDEFVHDFLMIYWDLEDDD